LLLNTRVIVPYIDVLKQAVIVSGNYIWSGIKIVGQQFKKDFRLPTVDNEPYDTGLRLTDGTPVYGNRKRIRPGALGRMDEAVSGELAAHGQDIKLEPEVGLGLRRIGRYLRRR